MSDRKTEIAKAVCQVALDLEDIERRKKTAMEGFNATRKDLKKQMSDLLHELETGQKHIGDGD